MADWVDYASEWEMAQREQALRKVRVSPHAPAAQARAFCAACEVAIPHARQQALPGVRLCIDCQNQLERQSQI